MGVCSIRIIICCNFINPLVHMDYQYEQEKNGLTVKDHFQNYLKYWKLFLISGILCVLLAFFYLKYTPVEYKVTSTILIKGEKAGILSELSAFEDLSIVKSNNKEVENEIEILKSRPLFENVVKKLKLHHQYFAKRKFSKRLVELYKNRPITVFFVDDSLFIKEPIELKITINSKTDFTIKEEKQDVEVNGIFAKEVKTRIGNVLLTPNQEYFDAFLGKEIFVSIQAVSDVVEDYKTRINIGLVNKDANVISLKLNTATREKAKDILNGLVEEYNIDAIRDKNMIYENTANFIKERLSIINTELSDIEHGVEKFKTSNNLTNVTTETELFLETSSDNKRGVLETNTQLGLVDFMNTHLKGNTEDLLPVNLGFSDEAITSIIASYNETALRRNEVLKGTTSQNPIVVSLNDKLESLRVSLQQSLNNQKTTLKIKLKNLERQESRMRGKIASLPKKERELRDIVRQQEIKETLYLYLLQKREETAISLSATVANAKVIEKAYCSKNPVKPKKRIVVLVALFGTLLVPAILIFFKDLFDTKVKDRLEIEKTLDIPIVAEIPKVDTKENVIISTTDRSVTAEAFRIFESNLKFLLSDDSHKQCKTILITSSTVGEGKTFISTNLSIALADPDKKVALLGLDLRSPKVLEYLAIDDYIGVSNYIRDEKLTLDDICISMDHIPNLDIICSGVIPPNPIELIKSKRLQQLITELKDRYDYLVIDTPPVSLVADALLLSEYVDLCIYIVRSDLTERKFLKVVQNLYKDKRFTHLSILLNGIETQTKSYYGYSYGQPQKSKPWWKFF